jgi:hypothetical protein
MRCGKPRCPRRGGGVLLLTTRPARVGEKSRPVVTDGGGSGRLLSRVQFANSVQMEKTTVCHCTDCQVGTGSAFRVNVLVPGATFRITGQPATYLKTTAESGNPRLQAFCPRCGSPIYSTSPGEGQQASYMVRVGILRQRRDFAPRRQNWFRSALPWVSSLATLHRNEKQA